MLSILIPTFNYDITPLVNSLFHQAQKATIVFEIIVMEDGSTLFKNKNKSISTLEGCKYIELPHNIGRSAIRNKLADTATYHHLLFLDCDSEPASNDFIQKYLTYCKDDCVVMGGRVYDENEKNPEKSLISTYGRKRERYNSSVKNKSAHQMFMTPNFLIPKTIFNKVRFDETIVGYGHEDTIFGLELEQLNIHFSLIDNPVFHRGLEDNTTFLTKTEYALENLYRIYLTGKYPTLAIRSKVLHTFVTLKKLKAINLIVALFTFLKPLLVKNLKGPHPKLLLFDFYKLGHLCTIYKKEMTSCQH